MKLLLLDRPINKDITIEREIEFFGPWAQPIDTPEDLIASKFEPYPNSDSVYSASLRAIHVANKLLEILSKIMPSLTGVNKGERFWRLLLGYDSIILGGIVEDIKMRHRSLPEREYILGLPRNDGVKTRVPYGSKNGIYLLSYDIRFRWQAMALYLKTYYKNQEVVDYFETYPKKATNVIEDFCTRIAQKGYKGVFKKINSILYSRIGLLKIIKINSNIRSLIWDNYHLEDFDFSKLNSSFLFNAHFLDNIKLPLFKVAQEKRKMLKEILPYPYGELLSLSLPLTTLEGLADLVTIIEKNKYPQKFKNIKRIYTNGQAFCGNELDKTFISLLAEEGKEIISIQHGGGGYIAHTGIFLERLIADEFISWGTNYSNYNDLPGINNIRPLPSIYLSNLRQGYSLKKKRRKWNVLFVVLEENLHMKWLYNPLFPDLAYDYFRRQKVLFDNFSTKEKVAVKIYPEICGWKQRDWIRARYPSIKLLASGRFVDYALSAGVIIIDYNSTAFLEMLAWNKPFLATWNRRWFRGQKRFEEFIDRLIKVSIFYEHSQDLINAYKNIDISKIELWWKEKERQVVINEMVNNFAFTSYDYCEKWNYEFIRGQ